MNDRIYVGSLISEPHLYHHGILGMKWGVRRFQNKDGSYTSAGKQRYGSGINQKDSESKKGLSDKQKTALKIGAGLVAGALVAYGGYSLAKSGKLDKFIKKGSTVLPNNTTSGGSLTSSVKGIKPLKHSETSKESELKVNPYFSIADPAYYTNCGNCALALEARQRGIDAEALGNSRGITISQMGSFFKDMKSENVTDVNVNVPNVTDSAYLAAYKKGGRSAVDSFYRNRGLQVKDEITKQIASSHPIGSRGCLFVPMETSSHWVSWEVDKTGKVNFFNSQEPSRDLESTCFGHYTYHKNDSKVALTAIRYDNLSFADNVHELIGQAGKKPQYQTYDTSIEPGSNFVIKYK